MDFEFSGEESVPPPKSTFVTVLAWIFILLGGFSTLISILQNLMFHLVFPKDQMTQLMQSSDQMQGVPVFAQLMFRHFELFFLFFLAISVLSLVAAITLLKRKNWARLVFILLMAAGIVWNLFGLVLQFTFFNGLPQLAPAQNFPPEFQHMLLIMKIGSALMAVGLSVLFGFVIRKLCSAAIRLEFRPVV